MAGGSLSCIGARHEPHGSLNMGILETFALTRRFGDLTTVDQLTLAVEPGEVFGLLGPNGAGKTTAIKMLTTLLPPSAGNATADGYDIACQAAQVRRNNGYTHPR